MTKMLHFSRFTVWDVHDLWYQYQKVQHRWHQSLPLHKILSQFQPPPTLTTYIYIPNQPTLTFHMDNTKACQWTIPLTVTLPPLPQSCKWTNVVPPNLCVCITSPHGQHIISCISLPKNTE